MTGRSFPAPPAASPDGLPAFAGLRCVGTGQRPCLASITAFVLRSDSVMLYVMGADTGFLSPLVSTCVFSYYFFHSHLCLSYVPVCAVLFSPTY